MRLEFPPPAAPWSTNQDRSLHHMTRHDLVSLWKAGTRFAYVSMVNATGADRAQPPSVIQVNIPFKDNRKRDPHNYCGTVLKAIVDGLVEAGAWPDDTPEYVGHREPVLHKGSAVIVTTTPMQPMEEQ